MHDLNHATHARLLIVDDNRAIHSDLCKVLDGEQQAPELAASAAALFGDAPEPALRPKYEIDSAYQGQEALACLRAALAEGRPYALAFVDMRMPPGWDGVETIERLWREDPDLQICICTAFSDYSWSEITARLKSNDRWLILKKPFDNIEVCQVAAALAEKRRLSAIAELRRHDLEALVEQRTASLHEANMQLRGEIVDRIETEDRLREREAQLNQAKKLEAVGQLAGGIAHEFNNLLQIITGHGQCALEDLSADEPLYQDIQQILQASDRAAALTNQLLGFSRRQVLRPKVVDIHALMTDFIKLARPLFGERITIHAACDRQTKAVNADVDQLRQAFLNLALNARDAMSGGGTLTVTTRNVSLAAGEDRATDELAPGEYVEISIADTGSGIPLAIREHVFEPFFTTKEVGKGTGLGLAMVHGVIKQHNGWINVSSQEGEGTAFQLLLPAVEQAGGPAANEPPSEPRCTTEPPSVVPAAQDTTTILLAEDDHQVRAILARTLTHAGYRVLEASDGRAALEVFRGSPDIQLALLDVVMPRMDGWELYNRLRAERPDLRAVFCTGYDPIGGPAAHVAGLGVPVLRKPITRDSLLKTIRLALTDEHPTGAHHPDLVASGA